MKRGFYLRLAIDGMRKNKRLYIPYLITCAGMEMMFYILRSLACSNAIGDMRGGGTLGTVLMLGSGVLAVFSLLFLFYTNSFLVRRRNKEFGLYNILGMNKDNISRIVIIETVLTAIISLAAGLTGGILLSKLAELILLKLAEEEAGYSLWIDLGGVLTTAVVFGVIFLILLIVSLAKISLSKPLDLLKSEATGEKPPKANFLFALAGLVILGIAYYLALDIETPLAAIGVFFLAVIMVIVATYLLFITGSVALCKVLQKSKSYYYKPAHFVSVSSMAFRMKRNGAGLASICILATMVLVMLSSTSCLYFGGEDAVRAGTPYDIMGRVYCVNATECSEAALDELSNTMVSIAGGHEANVVKYSEYLTDGYFSDGLFNVDGVDTDISVLMDARTLNGVRSVKILSLKDYNRLAGTDERLAEDEALIWASDKAYPYDTFGFLGCETVKKVRTIKSLPVRISSNDLLVSTYVLVVPDWEEFTEEIDRYMDLLNEQHGNNKLSGDYRQYCCFDLPDLNDEEQIEMSNRIWKGSDAIVFSYAEEKSEFFGMYGGLFFLGIVLSVVFIAAAALIIYYKQLSEGYEDQSRFSIMQKVGMTKRDIKNTINSQVLTVFFTPLILAGIHLTFAFPYIYKILRIFYVENLTLLIGTNVLCFLLFSLFYIFVYRRTAHAYNNIVSDMDVNK